jgi:hypothetical protein
MPGACPDGTSRARTDGADADSCHDALQSLFDMLPGGAVVVAPDSKPGVVPPLGWALSEMSQKRFTAAIDAAMVCPEPEEQSTARYADLLELAKVMKLVECPPSGK